MCPLATPRRQWPWTKTCGWGKNDNQSINYAWSNPLASIISDISRHTFFEKFAGEHTRMYVAALIWRTQNSPARTDTGALKMHEEPHRLGLTCIHTDTDSDGLWLGCCAKLLSFFFFIYSSLSVVFVTMYIFFRLLTWQEQEMCDSHIISVKHQWVQTSWKILLSLW